LFAAPALFAQAPQQTFAQVFDGQISSIEREVLGLAQKMPADKYNFAPATGTPPAGTFDGVRTFALQVRHIATLMYELSAGILDEKAPGDLGTGDNGPDSVQTKDQIIEYFQGAVAFAHKAARSITAENALLPIRPVDGRTNRAAAAAFIGLHTYDHYGQMVVYARLNGVTPGGPPAGGKGKAKGK
jgi:hypothetical protein